MKRQLPRATAFNAAKYRNNPKLIAKYLNDAHATDDTAFITGAIGNLARPRNGGHCRRGERRSRRSLQILPRRHGSRIRDSFEGADNARYSAGGKAGRRLVELGAEKQKDGTAYCLARVRWSPDEEKRLINLIAAGKSWTLISGMLKRSMKSVKLHAKTLRLVGAKKNAG